MLMHSGWIAELKLEAYNRYWSLVRVAGGNDKLNLDLVRSVEINCTCAGQVKIVCRFRSERSSGDRVSISPGDILEFVGVRLRFEKSSPRWSL